VLGQRGVRPGRDLGRQARRLGRPDAGRPAGPGGRRDGAGLPPPPHPPAHGGHAHGEAGGGLGVGRASRHRGDDPLAQINGIGSHDASLPDDQLIRNAL